MKTIEDGRFEVKDGKPGTGKGLFTRDTISKGSFVIEYTGIHIPTKEADEHRGRYLFQLDDEWTIDGEASHGVAKYINHSCEPNMEARIKKGADAVNHIMMYALRSIGKGEELTLDYGDEYFNDFIRPVGCKCGSKNCRSK